MQTRLRERTLTNPRGGSLTPLYRWAWPEDRQPKGAGRVEYKRGTFEVERETLLSRAMGTPPGTSDFFVVEWFDKEEAKRQNPIFLCYSFTCPFSVCRDYLDKYPELLTYELLLCAGTDLMVHLIPTFVSFSACRNYADSVLNFSILVPYCVL